MLKLSTLMAKKDQASAVCPHKCVTFAAPHVYVSPPSPEMGSGNAAEAWHLAPEGRDTHLHRIQPRRFTCPEAVDPLRPDIDTIPKHVQVQQRLSYAVLKTHNQ